ncbi:phosphoinositide 5-phosphatase [Theileria orientalis]|uniref:Phosphoinositide 5-phosphatase n=1 Tax=Theileria orientalis TaxID=68886 RepID=A0A976MCX8_THEOR|nr:phosphoinositide 5-phosphatase [Theileria orientalis]
MYIWNVFKTLVYLLFCSKKFAYSDPTEKGVITELVPIELNLYKRSLNDKYEYKQIDKSGIYTVKDGYGFASVGSFHPGSKFRSYIWKASNSSEYANKVILISSDIGDLYKIFIHLFDGTRNVYFKKLDSPWKRMDVNRNVRIPVNLNIVQDTNFYNVTKDGDLKIFTPRTGFVFDSIIHWINPADTKRTIWKARNRNECSSRIEYFVDKTLEPNFGILMIYLLNGEKIKLITDNVNYIGNTWILFDLKKEIPIQIRIDNTKDSLFYENYLSGPLRVIDAKPGFVFNGLFHWNDRHKTTDIIWRTLRPDKYSRQVLVEPIVGFKIYSNNVIIFHLDGTSTHLMSVDDGWSPIEPSIELDIGYKLSTVAYQYIKIKDIEYFIPNGSFLFKQVLRKGLSSKSDIKFWKAKNQWEYVKKVFIVPLGKKEKYLVLLLVTNKLILFLKSEVSPWILQPNDEYAIYRLLSLGVDFSIPKRISKQIEQEQCRPQQQSVFQPNVSEPEIPVLKSEIEPEKLIELDINKMHGLKGYDIFYRDNKVIFTAREPYLFSSVINGNEILWKPKSVDEYADKVIYKVVNGNHKIKVYFPDENRYNITKNKALMDFNPSEVEVLVVKTNKPNTEI